MVARLKFGIATSNEGFTPLSTASFSDLRPARIVRELIQNSLDAAVVEADEDAAIVRFQVEPILRRQIPDVRGYEKAFEKAVAHQTKISDGKLPDAAQQVVDNIKGGLHTLKSKNATLLSVLDNGVGPDGKRMNSLLGDGSSAKSEDSSGSYGVGHLAPMALSDLRYMLYGGVMQNGQRIVSGRAILASHAGRNKLNAAEGYLINDFRDGLDGRLYDFISAPYPPIVTNCLDKIRSEWGHGSVVMMPVFNNFRDGASLWEVVSKVAAYNFCVAIHQGKLVIEVNEAGETRKLDKIVLVNVLEKDKERTRAARSNSFFEGLRPSGQNAYSILKTLSDQPRQKVIIRDGAVCMSLMSPSLSGNTRVDLFRNGMWITDDVFALRKADFANHQPFHAVIEVEAEESGELHKLIRKAEGPMHDALSFTLLSKAESKKLKKSLRQIAEHIREQVPKVGSKEYRVDDFLLVNTSTGWRGGASSFSFWGIPTLTSRKRSNQLIAGADQIDVDPPDDSNNPQPPRPPKPPPATEKKSRPLPFRSAVAPNGERKLSASISSEGGFPEIWILLRVDENTDITCDRIWQDENVSIVSFRIRDPDGDGKSLDSEIASGGKVVKVRGLSGNVTYEVDIEYNAPEELSSVVGTPVFRLEIHRPPNPPTDGQKKTQNANNT